MQLIQHIHRVLVGLAASVLAVAILLPAVTAQPERLPSPDQAGAVEPLTRGPIHEAFGTPSVFNPQPGLVVSKKPPDLITEIPPDQKPAGDNVMWIAGYWGWDPNRQDYVWVSGFWRTIPPGRQWVPGYWKQVSDGYQWVSGYWAGADQRETVYLPQPPESLDVGPSTEAPAADHIWSPGYWAWETNRYFWRPGYWLAPQTDWVWCAPHYCWSPSGYIFVNGFWDYPLARRGLLFCPVYYNSAVYLQPGYVYTPSVFVDVSLLVDNLFCWPRYYHYCFGDFYGGSFAGLAIYPWFSFHNRYGWDPWFAYYRSYYGARDPGWASRLVANHRFRESHVEARPPVTFAAQQQQISTGRLQGSQFALAKPLSQSTIANKVLPLERISQENRQAAQRHATELRGMRNQRIRLESQALARGGTGVAGASQSQPRQLALPPSPVSRPGIAANVPPLPRGEAQPRVNRTVPPSTVERFSRPPAEAPREERLRQPWPGTAPRMEQTAPPATSPRPDRQAPRAVPRTDLRPQREFHSESRLSLPPAVREPHEPRIMTQRTVTPHVEHREAPAAPHVTSHASHQNVGPTNRAHVREVHEQNHRHQ